jgi:surface-anchored protein
VRINTVKAAFAAAIGLALTVGLPSAAAPHTPPISPAPGDVFASSTDGTTQTLDSHVEKPPAVHDPADVVFDVHSGHKITMSSTVNCVANASDVIWMIPRNQAAGRLWAGWNTDDVNLGDFNGGKLRLELVDAVTPSGGVATIFDPGSPGTVNTRVSTDTACDPGGTDITESHHHPSWAFTAAGTYELTFTVTGQHNSHGAVSSGDITFTFVVS